jgi:hypothetical protein
MYLLTIRLLDLMRYRENPMTCWTRLGTAGHQAGHKRTQADTSGHPQTHQEPQDSKGQQDTIRPHRSASEAHNRTMYHTIVGWHE